TSDATVNVGGLEPGASWEYSTDGGETWLDGTGTSFELPAGEYETGDVLVRQTDLAGNTSLLGTLPPITIDTSVPAALEAALADDTGFDGDGITSDGTVNVTGLEEDTTWQYSLDAGETWIDGSGTSFELDPGTYGPGQVQVRQIDDAGNISPVDIVPVAAVIEPDAAGDTNTVDLGERTSVTRAPITDESLLVLGLTDTGTVTNGVAITIPEGSTGDVAVEVSQTALVAVADAFNIEVYTADGQLVAVADSDGNPLVGDVAGIVLLGLTSDNTVTATFPGLPPGDYFVVVRKGTSALGTLLDTDNDGITLEELGQGGVVLGAGNETAVLNAVQTALNGTPGLGLGTVVRGILEVLLDTTDELGAADLVVALTDTLTSLGLTEQIATVLDIVAETLLSNTLTLLQDTSVTVVVTEQTFEGAGTPATGNVIDPNLGTEGEAGEDTVVPGSVVTQVQAEGGAPVEVNGATVIEGEFGTLTINPDGSYSYLPNGSSASVGATDVFTYTVSDGTNEVTATLTIAIDGEIVADDVAQAGIEYDYAPLPGVSLQDTVNYSFTAVANLGLAQVVVGAAGDLIGDSFTVAAGTTQDVTLDVDVNGLLGLGSQVTLILESGGPTAWTEYATIDADALVSLLGTGGDGSILIAGVPPGTYRVRADIDFVLGVGGSVEVDVTSIVNDPDALEVSEVFPVEGDLFENDLPGADAGSLLVSADGTAFTAVTGGPVIISGLYGDLVVNGDGTYTYTPDDDAGVGQFEDTFYYRVEVDGEVQEATLTVQVNGTLQGEDPAVDAAPEPLLAEGGDTLLALMLAADDAIEFDNLSGGDDDGDDPAEAGAGDAPNEVAVDGLFSEDSEELAFGEDDGAAAEAAQVPEDTLSYLPMSPVEDDPQQHPLG
ncbi:BapA/Bap/LapF family large adhesin, partial [Terrihabitans rhizophilus]